MSAKQKEGHGVKKGDRRVVLHVVRYSGTNIANRRLGNELAN